MGSGSAQQLQRWCSRWGRWKRSTAWGTRSAWAARKRPTLSWGSRIQSTEPTGARLYDTTRCPASATWSGSSAPQQIWFTPLWIYPPFKDYIRRHFRSSSYVFWMKIWEVGTMQGVFLEWAQENLQLGLPYVDLTTLSFQPFFMCKNLKHAASKQSRDNLDETCVSDVVKVHREQQHCRLRGGSMASQRGHHLCFLNDIWHLINKGKCVSGHFNYEDKYFKENIQLVQKLGLFYVLCIRVVHFRLTDFILYCIAFYLALNWSQINRNMFMLFLLTNEGKAFNF